MMTMMSILTPRKQQVAKLIFESATNKQIAAAIGLSERQVEHHVAGIARIWRLDHAKNLRVQIALRFSTLYGDHDQAV